ncbi:uncharacterized protein [Watersipora subatra]|uniref:uncharacterized protein n=1 Tax=Watersipora subatra TaxID=2589382 RepID=UPI00355BAC29
MTSRISSAFSSCAIKNQSESVEVITPDSLEETMDDRLGEGETTPQTTESQAQPSFLWRVSSSALGGAYNAASGAAGMGYNSTKWVLGKGVELGSTVAVKSKDVSGSVISKTADLGATVVNKMPVPSRFKAKDKKE